MECPLPPAKLAELFSAITGPMLQLKFSVSNRGADPSLFWRTGIVSIPGERPVAVAISSDQASCTRLTAAMFACTDQDVDLTMAEDALSELANMAAGEVKRALRLDQALALPKVLQEVNLSGQTSSNGWAGVVLESPGGQVLVSISTEPQTVKEHTV
jgi:CheY-specific phosphatase CheX